MIKIGEASKSKEERDDFLNNMAIIIAYIACCNTKFAAEVFYCARWLLLLWWVAVAVAVPIFRLLQVDFMTISET